MNLQLPSPSLGAPPHLPPWCALLAPNPLTASNLTSNFRPNPTQTTTRPILPALLLTRPPTSQALLLTPTPFEFA